MAASQSPVTLDHDSNAVVKEGSTASSAKQSETKSQRNSTKSNVKDSSGKLQIIAKQFHLDEEIGEGSGLDISKRVATRHKQIEERRQRNLEKIIAHANAACRDEAAGTPDEDWLHRYFEMAQDIGNNAMQRLWAQVLKKEIINPGSTSVKSLKLLKDLSPKEAQTLQRAASLACSFGGDGAKKLVTGFKAKGNLFQFGRTPESTTLNLGAFQLPYSSLLLLIDLGLILGTELESGEIEHDPMVVIQYQGKHLGLEPHTKGSRLVYYRFSPVGNELCRLLGNKPNMKYHDQLVALLNQKFTVTSDVKSTVSATA